MPYRLSLFLALLLCLSACSDSHWHPDPASSDAKTLKIAVFGSSAENPQNYNASQEGAELAQKTDEFKAIAGSVIIDPRDDAESVSKAIDEARRIRDDPEVLAVVGHSYSGTTRAAMPIYEQAGIPVVIPTATSPYVLYKFDDHGPWPGLAELENRDARYTRFGNAFRLIPSDVPSQVEAIEAATRKLLHLQDDDQSESKNAHLGKASANSAPTSKHQPKLPSVMLVCEVTKKNGAEVYTKPICDSLLRERNKKLSIAPYVARYKEIDAETVDVWELVTEIHAVMRNETAKHIVFVGYPDLARVMLEELKERSQPGKNDMSSYTFIMSEACLSNELLDFGATIYVTSPFNRLQVVACLPDLKQVMEEKNIVPSAEAYSYDAVVILAKAASACKAKNQLGRECVLGYLQENGENLPGKCENYWIGRGERKAAPYYVYAKCNGKLDAAWEIGTDHDVYEEWQCKKNAD